MTIRIWSVIDDNGSKHEHFYYPYVKCLSLNNWSLRIFPAAFFIDHCWFRWWSDTDLQCRGKCSVRI